jgi:hypothetical protein
MAALLDEARRSMLTVEPEHGEHLAVLIKKIYATPKPIVDEVGEALK